MKQLWLILLSLVACSAFGQNATIIEYEGRHFGYVTFPDGHVLVLKQIVVLKAPKPVPSGIAHQFIVLRDQTTATNEMVSVLLDLQEKYQKGTKPEMFVLDKKDPSKLTQSWLAIKPPAATFPYYFLIEKGGRILDQGPVATTTEQNVANIAKFQEKP